MKRGVYSKMRKTTFKLRGLRYKVSNIGLSEETNANNFDIDCCI